MSAGGLRLREVFSSPNCVMAAPVFDPLSTHLAARRGWDVCKLSGTVWKGAELAVPDAMPLATMTDLADIVRRILRVADVALMVDADDGGASAVSVFRTVRELEAAGAAAIEIEDNSVPTYYGQAASRHELLVSKKEQIGKLRAAVDARREDSTVIVARLVPKAFPTLDEALDRIVAYSDTGVDAIMLPGLQPPRDGRADVEAIHAVTELPLLALGLPWELEGDAAFMASNNVKIRYVRDFPLYRMAIRGIDDCLAYMEKGGNPADLEDRMIPMGMVRDTPQAVNREGFFREWSQKYVQLG